MKIDDEDDEVRSRMALEQAQQSLRSSMEVNKAEVESAGGIDMFDGVLSDSGIYSEDRPDRLKAHVREAEPTDDSEGYYRHQIGEILGDKYKIIGFHGQGVFSNVLKAIDVTTNDLVAIKLLRNNDHFRRTGKKEIQILKQLHASDPEGKFNNIRLLGEFMDREHLCLVFEPMDLNLRQLIKKTGGKGLNLNAIRVYGFKLLKALLQLRKEGIIHADMKPDNILVNDSRTVVKLADLGSAMEEHEYEPTPLLVSRFYRSPEIILGLRYSYPLDMFSFACVMYELATGKPMLRSRDNNHHLLLLTEYKGAPPKPLLRNALFRTQYFDEQSRFLETVVDTTLGKVRLLINASIACSISRGCLLGDGSST